MKLHIKRMPGFTFNAAGVIRMLAVMAFTISSIFLSATPLRAQTGTPVPLQCQVRSQAGSNGISYSIVCNGTLPGGGSVGLNCQSPNAITDNNGVFTVAGTCVLTTSMAGFSVIATGNGTGLMINADNGSITAASGSVTLTVANALSSTTVTCGGAAFTESLSPLTLSDPGTCGVTTSVLGIGTAQLIGNGGSTISVTDSPNPVISINSPSISASASLLGLINVSTTCGTSVIIHLNEIFPITIPALCSGS